ncbi:hypothetical protein SCWH03_25710 [Streptomyces pacificus]|uniref:Uncharacterized protein n=1 Tax=Streptomyces pacificus TaxID=2705029 RepID=A0A6A0AWL0_9ACTN|nr:hypothetical protein SCWH03_25710 [Streptomyces pacificus]
MLPPHSGAIVDLKHDGAAVLRPKGDGAAGHACRHEALRERSWQRRGAVRGRRPGAGPSHPDTRTRAGSRDRGRHALPLRADTLARAGSRRRSRPRRSAPRGRARTPARHTRPIARVSAISMTTRSGFGDGVRP